MCKQGNNGFRQFGRIDTAGNDLTRDVFRIGKCRNISSKLILQPACITQTTFISTRRPIIVTQSGQCCHLLIVQFTNQNAIITFRQDCGFTATAAVCNFNDIGNPAAESWSLLTSQ